MKKDMTKEEYVAFQEGYREALAAARDFLQDKKIDITFNVSFAVNKQNYALLFSDNRKEE